MSLKAILDDVSAAPEAVRSFYTKIEGDDAGDLAGKYRLDIEAAHGFSLDAVDPLKSALSAEREAKRALETKYKDFEGMDAKAAKAAIAKLAKIGNLDPAVEADRIAGEKVEAIKSQILTEVETERTGWKTRETTLTGELRRVLVDNAALTALSAHKGNPELLQRVVTDRLRLTEKDGKFGVEVIDANGNPRIKNAKGELMSVEDLVVEMRADKRYGVAFESNAKGGGGTPADTNNNNTGAAGRYTRAEWNKKLGEADEATKRKLTSEYMANQIEIVG
ncbi:hypothetical protein NKJ26_03280 [Mesorhizobium sp. M0152]|uniref:hypothetical protein n=1 Tax=Mesorhizobium sp. M0152 TaxID=2956898 RepID=UPI00333DFD93